MKPLVYLFSTSPHPQTIHINSLDITFLKPEIDLSGYDGFILTSKQAVNSLIDYDKINFKPAICISKQTANAYINIGGKVLDVGEGYGDNLEALIKNYSKEKKWLYIRAETIASNFSKTLQDESYLIDETIFYRTRCSKKILSVQVKKNSVLIFTSPSSVLCFLKNNTIDKNSSVIVIGNTTAKALPAGIDYRIALKKTIESCLSLIN